MQLILDGLDAKVDIKDFNNLMREFRESQD
jgi:hypothetical protein